MAIIKALFDRSVSGVAEAFGAPDIASAEMQEAIRSWIAEYFRRTPSRESDPCQRLPYTIVHKLEKGMFAEYASDIQDADSGKGAWMAENLAQLDRVRGEAMQWMLISGEAWLKPVPCVPAAAYPAQPGGGAGPRAGRRRYKNRHQRANGLGKRILHIIGSANGRRQRLPYHKKPAVLQQGQRAAWRPL